MRPHRHAPVRSGAVVASVADVVLVACCIAAVTIVDRLRVVKMDPSMEGLLGMAGTDSGARARYSMWSFCCLEVR